MKTDGPEEPDILRRVVSPINDPAIRQHLNRIKADQFAFVGNNFSSRERVSKIETFTNQFTKFADYFLSGLNDFKHIYLLSGNSEYINTVFSLAPEINFFENDYRYYKIASQTYRKSKSPAGEFIMSYPSRQNGTTENLVNAKENKSPRRHLDVAYLALTNNPNLVNVSEFQTVGITLSKTFAIPFNRFSLMFSKEKIPHFDVLQNIGYCNLSAVEIARELLDIVTPEFWIKKYWNSYINLCREYKLSPSNCLLFAYNANGQRVSTSELFSEKIL